MFAAHGIGCILAVEGRLAEAKDVFVSVREAESNIPEPWLNLAHVYLEQKNFINAIKLYVSLFSLCNHTHTHTQSLYPCNAMFL